MPSATGHPFDYALAFPEAMGNFKNNFNDFLTGYIVGNKDKIASDLSQYQKAHPTEKISLQDFLSLPSESNAIDGEVLREMALEGDVKEIQQDAAQTAANIAEFLVRMELSLHFLTAFANIPNDAPRDLTPAELVEYNITNTQ